MLIANHASSILSAPSRPSALMLVGKTKFAIFGLAAVTILSSCAIPANSRFANAEGDVTVNQSVGNTANGSITPEGDVLYRAADPALFPVEAQEVSEGAVEETGNRSGLRPKFGVTTAVTHDDNLYLTNKDQVSDVEFSVTPDISLGLGDVRGMNESYAALNYRPTGRVYVDNSGENAIDHDASVSAQYRGGKLRTKGDASFVSNSGSNRELGGRVDENIYAGTVEAAWDVTGKTSVGARAGATNQAYKDSQFSDTSDRFVEGFADYAITGKSTVGVGARAGNIVTDGSGDQDYGQVFVRGQTQIAEKLGLSAKVGADRREVGKAMEINPIVEAAINYQPREGTSIEVAPYTTLNPSTINPGESYVRTGVNASVKQRLGKRFYVKVDGGYEKADYSASEGTAESRTDKYFYVRPAVGYEFKENLSAELYYRHNTNSSSEEQFGYDQNQVGASLNYKY